MFLFAVVIGLIANFTLFETNQTTIPICPVYFNHRVCLKAVIAFFTPGTIAPSLEVILVRLFSDKLNLLIHCVVKQFLNSPTYFVKTLVEVRHAFVVVVEAHHIDIPVVNSLKVRLFLDAPQ